MGRQNLETRPLASKYLSVRHPSVRMEQLGICQKKSLKLAKIKGTLHEDLRKFMTFRLIFLE